MDPIAAFTNIGNMDPIAEFTNLGAPAIAPFDQPFDEELANILRYLDEHSGDDQNLAPAEPQVQFPMAPQQLGMDAGGHEVGNDFQVPNFEPPMATEHPETAEAPIDFNVVLQFLQNFQPDGTDAGPMFLQDFQRAVGDAEMQAALYREPVPSNAATFTSIAAQDGTAAPLDQSPILDTPEDEFMDINEMLAMDLSQEAQVPAAPLQESPDLPGGWNDICQMLIGAGATINPETLTGAVHGSARSSPVLNGTGTSASATTGQTTPPLQHVMAQNGAQPAQDQQTAEVPNGVQEEIQNAPAPAASGPKKSRIACNRCKERKIKCDETHPQCSKCFKAGETCVYAAVVRKRGRAKKSIRGDIESKSVTIQDLQVKHDGDVRSGRPHQHWEALQKAKEDLAELEMELKNSAGSEPTDASESGPRKKKQKA